VEIDTPRQYFERLADHGHSPYLVNTAGTWEFDIEGHGSWRVEFEHGALRVVPPDPAREPPRAGARLRITGADFVRLARGDGHENVITALLRGALRVEGDLLTAQLIQAVLPVPTEWESAT
jgi:hypothetical protein